MEKSNLDKFKEYTEEYARKVTDIPCKFIMMGMFPDVVDGNVVNGLTWISNDNPSIFEEGLKNFMISTNKSYLDEGRRMNQGDHIVDMITKATLGYMEEMNFAQDYRKYKKFLKGDIDDLSSEDIDRFLDIKLNQDKLMKSVKIELYYSVEDDVHILSSYNYSVLQVIIDSLRLPEYHFSSTKFNPLNGTESILYVIQSRSFDFTSIMKVMQDNGMLNVKLINIATHEEFVAVSDTNNNVPSSKDDEPSDSESEYYEHFDPS